MNYLLGIDLGTTNCSVTSIDENGNTSILKNRDGDYITPSAVYFNENPNSYVIGKKAKEQHAINPENLVTLVKREMGKTKDAVRYNKIEQSYNLYRHWGRTFSPEEISSKILHQLKQDAERVLNCEVKQAVITCPAYFGQKEKEATRMAGELAGFDVLEVIPEPTAACLKYATLENVSNEKVFVFDLGGGTFDITIVDISDGETGKKVEVQSCSGDNKLGGADWDSYLKSYMINLFRKKFYIDLLYEDGIEKDKTLGKLTLDVEKLKKELSKPDVTEASITLSYKGYEFSQVISRSKYDEITAQLTDQCKNYCENLLKSNNLTWDDIDTILMIGSMSNCIFIQDALKKWSGKKVSFGVINPKTCVSEGAAIKAYSKICEKEGKQTVVNTYTENMNYDSEDKQDIEKIEEKMESSTRVSTVIESAKSVLSASICLGGKSREGKPLTRKMIKKDSIYPTSEKGDFPLYKDGMSEVSIIVLEGEDEDPRNCDELGNIVLPLEGYHVKGDRIIVTFVIDDNGILQVEGIDKKTGKAVKGEIRRVNSMSKEEIEQAKADTEIDEFFLG